MAVRGKRSHVHKNGFAPTTSTTTSSPNAGRRRSSTHNNTNNNNGGSGDRVPSAAANATHPVFPDGLPEQSELSFQCSSFLFALMVLVLQYVNLYRTTWWIAVSFTHFSLKLYEIDFKVATFLVFLLSLGFVRFLLNETAKWFATYKLSYGSFLQKMLFLIEYILKLPVICLLAAFFGHNVVHIFHEYRSATVVFLFFPIAIYAFSFLFEFQSRWDNFRSSLNRLFQGEGSLSEFKRSIWPPPALIFEQHQCSVDAAEIRAETDVLINDIYHRLRQSLLNASMTSFVTIALPVVFLPNRTPHDLPKSFSINEIWALQMGAVVFVTVFMHSIIHLFPLKYVDNMYRWEEAAWVVTDECVRRRPGEMPGLPWSPDDVPRGEGYIVRGRMSGKSFRARTCNDVMTVSADPDDSMHAWLAWLCKQPTSLLSLLCSVELCLILFQFWLLLLTVEWQQIITLTSIIFANYLLLAQLVKNRVILNRLYHPSEEDQEIVREAERSRRAATAAVARQHQNGRAR